MNRVTTQAQIAAGIPVTPAEVIQAVSDVMQVSVDDILNCINKKSERRSATARHIAIYLIRLNFGDLSVPKAFKRKVVKRKVIKARAAERVNRMGIVEIAELFGCTYANVVYATKNVQGWIQYEPELQSKIQLIHERVTSTIQKP